MDIRSLPAYSTAPVTNMARPARIPVPDHPLADRDGLVPTEVFDLPPELLAAIRGLPIRPVESPAGPRSAPSSPPADVVPEPVPSARARPFDASTFEIDL